MFRSWPFDNRIRYLKVGITDYLCIYGMASFPVNINRFVVRWGLDTVGVPSHLGNQRSDKIYDGHGLVPQDVQGSEHMCSDACTETLPQLEPLCRQ